MLSTVEGMKEGPHSSGIASVPIASTYLSCDLFQPFREPRITLPGVGVFHRPSHPAHWGVTHFEYGGTGKVGATRGHNHFGSGVTAIHAFPVPNRRPLRSILEDYTPAPHQKVETIVDVDIVQKNAQQQERKEYQGPAIRAKREHVRQSTLKNEHVPRAECKSSIANKDRSNSRLGCCQRCGRKILSTTHCHIDTTGSAEESSDTMEGSSNNAKEDVDSFTKLCPCVKSGAHSHVKDLLAQRRQQLQRPKPKSLFHKHTVLASCFMIPQQSADGPASRPDSQSHESRVETPGNTQHALPDSLPRNPQEGSLNAANTRKPQPTANCHGTLGNTASPRRLGEHEHATAQDTNSSTAPVANSSRSLSQICCFTQRKHHTNYFEKRLPMYLALHRPSRRVRTH